VIGRLTTDVESHAEHCAGFGRVRRVEKAHARQKLDSAHGKAAMGTLRSISILSPAKRGQFPFLLQAGCIRCGGGLDLVQWGR
jgi:hypothetical protein